MPSARTLAVFPSERICAKRRAALNFSARTSRRTRGPFVNVILNNVDVTPRLFVHQMDGGFSLEFFPSIGLRGVAMDRAIYANQGGARRTRLKLIVHVLRGCEGRSKGGVGMSRSSGIWVLAFVCLVLVLASSMMNVTDPAPVASNPTAAPWSVLGDSTFTFAYGGDMGANGSHAPPALARLRAALAP